eukprot:CAMPEP_0176236830 /NCGR_PEP_ID=MMETSP0121_2-20121125/27540_1 /TAXON_ID=160619 /ORGANISM="Kryptoperidinium foliaceum, Strain CCMP 1326" /LENGTH=229 /DNA_ID=CAMNT_0017576263 /DNA_START=31 /DNA_END=720 /DNA_ORIENTATION=-
MMEEPRRKPPGCRFYIVPLAASASCSVFTQQHVGAAYSGGDELPGDVLSASLRDLSAMLDRIVDEEVGEGLPDEHPAKRCKAVSAGGEVVAAREIFVLGFAAVPKLTAGRVLTAGARTRVAFRIAGTDRETTVDVAPSDLCLEGDRVQLEHRPRLKGPGPGGLSVGVQVLAAKDIQVAGVVRVARGAKGIVTSLLASKQRVQVTFQDGPSHRVRVNVKSNEIKVDPGDL